jgi:hypothetical protein
MILQCDKVVELSVSSLCSTNLNHFQLEWRNSNQSGTRFKQKNKSSLHSIEESGMAEIFNLVHAWSLGFRGLQTENHKTQINTYTQLEVFIVTFQHLERQQRCL